MMFLLIFICLILLFPQLIYCINAYICALNSILQEGDVIISAMLPFFIWQHQHNNSGHVHYVPLKERQPVALITGPSWTISSLIGQLLELYKFPQLTIGRYSPILSDNMHLTSLYHVASKDTFLAHAMISLILHFHWNWVGLFISDDERSIQFLSDFRIEMDKNTVCVDFVQILPTSKLSNSLYYNVNHNYRHLLTSSVNVIIIHFDSDFLKYFIHILEQSISRQKVWVMASPFDSSRIRNSIFLYAFHGSLMFSHHHQEISGFRKFIGTVNPSKYPNDTYLPIFESLLFDCLFSEFQCAVLKNCSLITSLKMLPNRVIDMAMSEESYNIYNAVYAVANSLHDLLLHQVEFQGRHGIKRLAHFPWKLHTFLRNIQPDHLDSNHVILDGKRKSVAEYDILNYCQFPTHFVHMSKVGMFSPFAPPGQQLSIHDDLIEWPLKFTETPQAQCSESCGPGFRKKHVEGKAICCFDCIPCSDNEISNETNMEQCLRCGDNQYASMQKVHCIKKAVTFLSYEDTLGAILAFLSLSFSALTVSVLWVFVKHRTTPIVKANNRTLSYILLISLTLCFLCSLLYIGQPSTATCILQQTTFGVVFTVSLSTVLAKTVTVVLAFRVTSPGRRVKWLLISRVPNFIVPFCSLIQLIPFGIWLWTSPPFVDIDLHSEYDHMIIVCNKGSVAAFYYVLGYLGCLAVGSFTLAYLVRNLPDTFNEAKFLTFSMLVFCSVWLTFLPVYQSTKGKAAVATEVFSILASGAGLLGCIFFPKCFIILIRPEKNYHYRNKHLKTKTYSKN